MAASLSAHPDHRRALPWLDAVASDDATGHCTWHALAETWSVLSRVPRGAVSPALAELVALRFAERLDVSDLDGALYRAALRRCSERGLRSGAVFDALHLVAAETANADAFVTFNAADFERLRSERSPAIVVPPEPPAFRLP